MLNSGMPPDLVGMDLAVVKVDDRYRIVLDKEIRERLKVVPGDDVLVIPSTDGVTIKNLKGKKFAGSLPGFNYREEEHEASRYLFHEIVNQKTQRSSRTAK